MATQPEHKPNGRPPMADDQASAGRIDAGVSYSRQENAVAAQTLMVGWANDMFTGTQDDGIYLDASQEFALDTVAGEATLVALPNPLTRPFLLPAAGARTAGECILHVRTGVRLQLHGRGRLQRSMAA
jgi:hypothetical protein